MIWNETFKVASNSWDSTHHAVRELTGLSAGSHAKIMTESGMTSQIETTKRAPTDPHMVDAHQNIESAATDRQRVSSDRVPAP